MFVSFVLVTMTPAHRDGCMSRQHNMLSEEQAEVCVRLLGVASAVKIAFKVEGVIMCMAGAQLQQLASDGQPLSS